MKTPRLWKTVFLWVCLFGLPFGAFWLGWRAAEILRAQSRFAQLEMALLRYHDEHGVFPPTRYQPEPGGPIHSWRVLLLPHLDREFAGRHAHYDYSHWWTHPRNLEALGREAPGFFRIHDEGYPGITHYLAIGEDDEWPSTMLLRSRLVRKGNGRFLLVEHPDSEIHWMEPKY